VWLQEFAWTDEEKYEKYLKRAADGEVGEQLAKEPMFCFGDPPPINAVHTLWIHSLSFAEREHFVCMCE